MKTGNLRHALAAGIGLLIALGGISSATGQSKLQEAYQKEFAHLEAQKRALEERLERVRQEGDQRIQQAKAERNQLQGQLTSLKQRADSLSDKLENAKRKVSKGDRGDQILASTVQQANRTLKEWGLDVKVPTEGEEKQYGEILPTLFEKGTDAVSRSRTMRVKEGEFFLKDGSRTEGTIVHLGEVAAWGVSDKASGALAPAGEGRLKIWNKKSADTAEVLKAGEAPSTLDAYLYESLDEGVQKKAEKTWLSTINDGGVIAWVIVAMGVLGLLLVLLRSILLALAGRGARQLTDTVGTLVGQGQRQKALERCQDASGAASRVMETAVDHLDEGREMVEDTVAEAILHEEPTVQRFGSVILVFAAVAPLLGLLGTVTGMISTFDVITKHGTGDPRMLSGGISEALITTQLGLIVAIPLLLLGNLLKGWGNRILNNLERSALRIVNVAHLTDEGGQQPRPVDEEGEPIEDEDDVENILGAV